MLAVYHAVADDFTRVKSSTCIFKCMFDGLSQCIACMHVDEFTRAKSSNWKRSSQSIVHVHLCRRIYTCKIVYTLLYKQRRKSSPNDRLQFTVTCMHVDEFTRVILSTNDRRHNALYMYRYVDEFTRVKSSTNYCTNKSTVVCRRFYTCKIVWTILLACKFVSPVCFAKVSLSIRAIAYIQLQTILRILACKFVSTVCFAKVSLSIRALATVADDFTCVNSSREEFDELMCTLETKRMTYRRRFHMCKFDPT